MIVKELKTIKYPSERYYFIICDVGHWNCSHTEKINKAYAQGWCKFMEYFTFWCSFVIFLPIHILTHTHTGCACVYLWIQRKNSRNENLKHYFNKLVPIVSRKDRSWCWRYWRRSKGIIHFSQVSWETVKLLC